MAEEEVSREEALLFVSSKPTDPSTLEWRAVLGIFKGYLRLRLRITARNVGPELLDALRTLKYQNQDPPEVKGLLAALTAALSKAGITCKITEGPKDLQQGTLGYFEPYKFSMPFKKAQLYLRIHISEIQWILRHANKEPRQSAARLGAFKGALRDETREWLRKGNR